MVARQHDGVITFDIDKNLQEPKTYLCAKFGCAAWLCCLSCCDHVGGVGGQRNEHTDRFYVL